MDTELLRTARSAFASAIAAANVALSTRTIDQWVDLMSRLATHTFAQHGIRFTALSISTSVPLSEPQTITAWAWTAEHGEFAVSWEFRLARR